MITNVSVVTRRELNLEASHILSFAWSARLSQLPENISNTVYDLSNKIDSTRNGILLHRGVSSAFDQGQISFRYLNDRDLEVVALDIEYAEYDGMIVEPNDRIRNNGVTWWNAYRPLPILIHFHLQNAVLKNLRGRAGSVNEIEDSEDEDMIVDEIAEAEEIARDKVVSYFETLVPPSN